MSQFLGSRYEEHKEIVERIATILVTEQDFQKFMQMMASVFEAGFMKAVNDYRSQGFQVEIKS